MNSLLGMTALLLLITLCLLGLFSRQFEDNLAQCVGLAMLALWALAQLLRLIRTQVMTTDDLWLCSSLLAFGLGTAVRTWLYKRKREAPYGTVPRRRHND